MNLVPDAAERRRALLVGLTGGIASGKSSVAGMFRESGISVIDADGIVHELLAAGGAAVMPVAESFGPEIIAADGSIDRNRLAEIVFPDLELRQELEQIVHPLVVAESRERIAERSRSSDSKIVIYDAALLVETKRYEQFDRLIVVFAKPEVQLHRLIERDRLSPDQAGARLRAQMPVGEKTKLADYVIENSGHWQHTRKQVTSVHCLLEEDLGLLLGEKPLPIRHVVPM